MPSRTVIVSGPIRDHELTRRLPSVCIVCGAHAERKPLRRTFLRLNPVVLLVLPLIFVPLVLLNAALHTPPAVVGAMAPVWAMFVMGTSGRVKLAAPVCRRHRRHWLWRGLILTLAFLPCLGLGIFGGIVIGGLIADATGADKLDLQFAGAMAGMIPGIYGFISLYLLLRALSVRAVRVDHDEVKLAGVSAAFASAIRSDTDREDEERTAQETTADDMKLCPNCSRRIAAYARACRFCKKILD